MNWDYMAACVHFHAPWFQCKDLVLKDIKLEAQPLCGQRKKRLVKRHD